MRDAWAPLQQMPTAITFFGHTHIQGGFSQKGHDWHELRPQLPRGNDADSWTMPILPGTRHLINPGSVGQPRDCDWRAAFAIYNTDPEEITFHRVPYDLTASQGPHPHGRPSRTPRRPAHRRPLKRSPASEEQIQGSLRYGGKSAAFGRDDVLLFG